MYKVLPIHTDYRIITSFDQHSFIEYCILSFILLSLSHSLHFKVISRKTEVFISFSFFKDFNILLFKEKFKISFFPEVLMFTNKYKR